jgi:hypothetical protein
MRNRLLEWNNYSFIWLHTISRIGFLFMFFLSDLNLFLNLFIWIPIPICIASESCFGWIEVFIQFYLTLLLRCWGSFNRGIHSFHFETSLSDVACHERKKLLEETLTFLWKLRLCLERNKLRDKNSYFIPPSFILCNCYFIFLME